MSENPKEEAIDFDEEIKKCREALEAKYPGVTHDMAFALFCGYTRSKEISHWFDRISGVGVRGGNSGAGELSLKKEDK